MTTTRRNDHEPGYIYLIEAIGFHGFGSPLKRCKIGLSRNPAARRQNFVDSQFPCDVKIIKSIFVEDMLEAENRLHNQFNFCNVELEKSQEWFDFSPWHYLRALAAFHMNEVHVFSFSELPFKSIGISLFSVLTIGILLGITGIKIANNSQCTEQLKTPAKVIKTNK